MTSAPVAKSTSQGLAFLAILSFVISFFMARLFTTVYPDVVVVSSGIHFHHFWYGLAMVVVAGWLGIASGRPEYDRVYAVVFGFGLGLVGDETGLLLTFGNYYSELTYVVFVVATSIAALAFLTVRYGALIRAEVMELGEGERAVHVGIGIATIAFLALAFGHLTTGLIIFAAGTAFIVAGLWLHRRRGLAPATGPAAGGDG